MGRKALHKQQDDACIGGMARTARCVAALPGNLVAGGHMRKLLDTFIADHPDVVEQCCSAIGAEAPDAGPSESSLEEFRRRMAVHFGVTDIGPVMNGDCTSPIRSGLLTAWARKANDPLVVTAK